MITRQSLAEHFGRLNNDELVTEFQSGGLTELAREVAAAEIQSRNIDISQYQARLPEPRPEPEMDSEDLVLLARFYDVSSAYLLQSRLDAEGLPSIVADALTYQNIIGGALPKSGRGADMAKRPGRARSSLLTTSTYRLRSITH